MMIISIFYSSKLWNRHSWVFISIKDPLFDKVIHSKLRCRKIKNHTCLVQDGYINSFSELFVNSIGTKKREIYIEIQEKYVQINRSTDFMFCLLNLDGAKLI